MVTFCRSVVFGVCRGNNDCCRAVPTSVVQATSKLQYTIDYCLFVFFKTAHEFFLATFCIMQIRRQEWKEINLLQSIFHFSRQDVV